MRRDIIETQINCDCCGRVIIPNTSGNSVFFSEFGYDICPSCSIGILQNLISQRTLNETEFNDTVEYFSTLPSTKPL